MQNIIHIPTAALKAALVIAPKSDVRYYLNSVHIQALEGGTQFEVAATDGHQLLVIPVPSTASDGGAQCEADLILPRATVDTAIKAAGRGADTLPLVWDAGERNFTLGRAVGQFIDGQYPDISRVIPSGEPGPMPLSNGMPIALYGRLDKVRAALGLKPQSANYTTISYPESSTYVTHFPAGKQEAFVLTMAQRQSGGPNPAAAMRDAVQAVR